MWALHDKFLEIVSSAWNPFIEGTRQFVLKQRLSNLKKPLQQLNGKHYSHISNRVKTTCEALAMEQQIALSGGTPTTDIRPLRTRAELMEVERLFFAQKARSDF